MKTITTILILLLISAAALFGIIAGKSISGPSGTEEEPSIEEVPEIVEETPPPLEENGPGTEEEPVEEEPDPDKISAIEIYLGGPRDKGIFLG
ncbi:MAG TPA: hypothetical protein DCP02_02340, partial [Actinobacteria bacterium]|nr:hypothetical protein [Actinomycetota bacterium]